MAGRSFPLPLTRRLSPADGTPLRLPRPTMPLRRLIGVLAAVLVLVGGWYWLRDSRLVSVDEVQVVGLSGSQAETIREALTAAGQDMTTLHVREDVLKAAVARYPVVADLRASGDFPHTLRISVSEHRAVAVLQVAGHGSIPVSSDGTLLRGEESAHAPTITMRSVPGGTRLHDPLALAQVRLLAAAPPALRAHVVKVFTGERGIELRLKNGPIAAFGAPDRIAAKWAALIAVLADPSSAGTSLIDLSVPERPAAAGLEAVTPADAGAGDATAAPADGTPASATTTAATAAPVTPSATGSPSPQTSTQTAPATTGP